MMVDRRQATDDSNENKGNIGWEPDAAGTGTKRVGRRYRLCG